MVSKKFFCVYIFACVSFLIFYPSNAFAQKLATCESFKGDPTRIEVLLTQVKPVDVRDYRVEELKEYRKKDFYKWKNADETIFWISDMDEALGAYFRPAVGVSVGFGFTVAPYEGQPDLSCVFVDYLNVYLHYSGTILLDSTYDEVECRDVGALVYDHLEGRYSIGSGIAISTEAMLKQKLPEIIAEMERLAVSADGAQDKVDNIKQTLRGGAEASAQDMLNQIIKLNTEVKAPEHLIARRKQCISEIPQEYLP